MNILVTGGAGFIGTHTLIELYKAGHTAVVVDNLSNSNPVALQRVEEIAGAGETPALHIPFYRVDIRDREGLEKVFAEHKMDACIHFAGLKAVGESVEKPWEYYENNIGGTLTLVDVMRRHGCKNIIFSSSATVYGDPAETPITERCPKGLCTNPYGWTKSMLEQILTDILKADPQWNVVLLRYFNPVGAHPSGRIGENPNGIFAFVQFATPTLVIINGILLLAVSCGKNTTDSTPTAAETTISDRQSPSAMPPCWPTSSSANATEVERTSLKATVPGPSTRLFSKAA
ncbi:MAG: NAD-dependent epimerase/dehydratase family protein [Bacteroidales bacterium]|nr:NAD-dependent epimerase/dehydratase family protein [Bacteroidales bacterium]